MSNKKNVLIIGGTSKIAQLFISKFSDEYHFAITQRQPEADQIQLDLSSNDSVAHFIDSQKGILYDGVLSFASVYDRDPDNHQDYTAQAERDMRINTLSPLAILKALEYTGNSTVILFGDAGTSIPKPNFSIYTMTKAALAAGAKSLAVDLRDTTRVLTLRLGPTVAPESREDKANFYSKNLFKANSPADGLINLCHFLIQENNLGMTGSEVEYDGGAYLKR